MTALASKLDLLSELFAEHEEDCRCLALPAVPCASYQRLARALAQLGDAAWDRIHAVPPLTHAPDGQRMPPRTVTPATTDGARRPEQRVAAPRADSDGSSSDSEDGVSPTRYATLGAAVYARMSAPESRAAARAIAAARDPRNPVVDQFDILSANTGVPRSTFRTDGDAEL